MSTQPYDPGPHPDDAQIDREAAEQRRQSFEAWEEMRRKGGRKPIESPRKNVMSLRWTDAEMHALKRAAGEEGVSLAAFVRIFALQAAGKYL